ncbi:MAG: hypothetical protein WBE18_01455 [Gammaproteobacteria bacterium]
MLYLKKPLSTLFIQKILILSGLLFLQPLAYAAHALPVQTVQSPELGDDTPISPEVINDESGPLQLLLVHSDPFGYILNGHWTNYLTPHNAFGFELDFGPNEFRLGGTWGHALTQQQRFKITAEHLAQRPNYGFVAQNDTQWQGQNAFGVTYQYLLDTQYVKAFNVSTYAATAENESFYQTIFTQNQQTFTDIPKSNGANSYGATTGLALQFWPTGLIDVAANYDNVHYNPQYVPAPNNQGLGATVGFAQLITDRVQFSASASDHQAYNQFQAKLAWLTYTRPGRHLEVAALGSRIEGDIPTGSDNRLGLSLAYSWGGDPNGVAFVYSLPITNNAYDLSNWTAEPAVHLPDVLAVKDELITVNNHF